MQDVLETRDRHAAALVAAHLETCRACQAHAQLLALLASLEPATDEQAAARIVRDLPLAPWQRRRFLTWAPLAAGVALVGAGCALLGGVPAAGSWSAMAGGAGETVAWLVGRAADTVTAARLSSAAVRSLLAAGGFGLVFWLLAAATGSGLAALGLCRRGRERSKP